MATQAQQQHPALAPAPGGPAPMEDGTQRQAVAGHVAMAQAAVQPPAPLPAEEQLLYVVTEASHSPEELTLRLLDEASVRAVSMLKPSI